MDSEWHCYSFLFFFTSWSACSLLRISGVATFNSVKQKDEVITSLTFNKCNPHVCCLWGIKRVVITDNQSQILKESCYFLLFLLVLLDRSNDSSLLCGGAVRWRDSDRWLWGKRGACRVCPGQEGHSLLSAGGDGSARPWLLPQFSRTSPRSVRETLQTPEHHYFHISYLFFPYFERNLKWIFQIFKLKCDWSPYFFFFFSTGLWCLKL